MERVVNILGMGASAEIAPKTENEEFWLINSAYKYQPPKIDKLFFFDGIEGVRADDQRLNPEYTIDNFLSDYPDAEIISRYENVFVNAATGKKIRTIKEYPLKEAQKLFHGGNFNSTIAYILAYAILEKVDRIRLYGFEIWAGTDRAEYVYQRPCVDFWIAFAMSRGIHVEVPYQVVINATNDTSYYGYCPKELKEKER